MADKYYRLVCFVVNICPQPLRELFIKLAKNDAGPSYTTLGTYLAHRQRDVSRLKTKRVIREDQYYLLYPGHGTADEKEWDITLLVTLITEMFASSLQPLDIFLMKDEIRGIRNELQHLPNTSNMSDDKFDNYWGRLDTAAMTIAKQVFNTSQEELFRNKIKNAKCNNLPDLGGALCIWYEEIIKQLENKLKEVESNTRETTSILRQVTVEKPGPSGYRKKRIKTADDILECLQASFDTTMRELPDTFVTPTQVVDIQTKLRDHHHVVVTGSYNSCYFETALAAIKGLNYSPNRCVEMHMPSDWRHIDPEDVDLVFCRHPFGTFSYDDTKAKSMTDIFNSMMHKANGRGVKTLDIVMVTDLKILTKYKEYNDHAMLEELVKVFDDTSGTQPVDLTLGLERQNIQPDMHNLRVITSNFLNQYRISSGQVDKDVIKLARDQFKSKKAVVLTGPKTSGKTSVAVSLASSYHPFQCSLLTEPSDFKKIDFQTVCLIIIDEFAGKYCFDEKNVYKWYDMFDHLYNAVTAGQMNVVITCEKNKLDKCCNTISVHPILEHRVSMPNRNNVIKQEESVDPNKGIDTDQLSSIDGHQRIQRIRHTQAAQNVTGPCVWSVKDIRQRNIRVTSDPCDCDVSGSCLLPSGEILLADFVNYRLKKLDDRYQLISVCDLPDRPWDVCYIGNSRAVVVLSSDRLQFVDISGDMTLIRVVETEGRCTGLTYHNNQLYVTHSSSVCIYSANGSMRRVLYTDQSVEPFFQQIAISDDGSLIYLADLYRGLITIDYFGNHQYTFKDSDLHGADGVCVDGNGHVLALSHDNQILQISSDGKQKLGIIENKSDGITRTLLFDKEKSTLVTAGVSNNISVLKLEN